MKSLRGMTLSAGVAAALLLALSGCAGGAAVGTTPATTVTVTSTVTATPSPASGDEPLDALSAWTACAVLAQEVYAKDEPTAKQMPYDPAHPPTQNADGSWQVTIGFPIVPPVQGAGSVIVICHLAGTKGEPKLLEWATKDV
ncbi:hypothetical protein [Leifsonia sp. NPDC077715]|uniref:hypothetical protein n=1 Tax=Leifsonia sp. NPDC077715 TaxID=3155539 RepID=UPI003428B6CD